MSYSTVEFWRDNRPVHQTYFGLLYNAAFVHGLVGYLQLSPDILYILVGLCSGMVGLCALIALGLRKGSYAHAKASWMAKHWGVALVVMFFS